MSNELKAQIAKANELGRAAYLNGQMRAPAMSVELNAMLPTGWDKSAERIKIMKAYLKGWDTENCKVVLS